jgi:4-diphosphocytidyl-2-C-methyl-D-erythritol kinase
MDQPPTGAGPVVEPAPAKLNLYLHVLGRRADGYHELDSLVAFAGIHDTVELRPAGELSLAVEGPMAGSLAGEDPASNLVARAAVLLAESLGRRPDVAIRLVKRLPVASGIGGGSADAAACLRALARLWGLDRDDPRLRATAPRLGADVPVCLEGRARYFGGIGDRLDPAPALPPMAAVLVNPGTALATPAVFAARRGPFSQPARFDRAPRDAAEFAELLAGRRNDLTEAAVSLAPVVAEVLGALAATKGCLLARLSGSGATCFGLYADAGAAEAAVRALAARPGWWVRATRLADGPIRAENGAVPG